MLVKIMIVASDFFETKGFIETLRATINRVLPDETKVSLIGAYRINHAALTIKHADIVIGNGMCKEHADYAVTGDEVVEYDASELAAINGKSFISMADAALNPEIVTTEIENFVQTSSR